MDWKIGNYWYLILLVLLPLLGWVMQNYVRWKKKRKSAFADDKFHQTLFEKQTKFSSFFPWLYLFAILFLILALVDIQHGSEKIKSKQRVNNVIFLLDVSSSMNAEDIRPSRLTVAKNILINTLSKMESDRVGIVIFAGDATSIMPLTTDYDAAETYISAIDTQIIKVQGTDFLEGVKEAVHKFSKIPKGAREIVLLSDGEDNEGNESAAAKLAKKEGISIISVGIGTEEGAPIPDYLLGQLMGYKIDRQNGETVISKRETNALIDLAQATGGSYVDGNNLEMATEQIVQGIREKSTTSDVFVNSSNAKHYFQYPLAVSLFLFVLIFLLNPKRDFNF